MPSVEVYAAIETPRATVELLVLDQAQRHRFLPDGWLFVETLTPETGRVGAQMVIEWRLGPSPLHQVIQLLDVEPGEVTRIVEGPPGGDNYITTWRISEDDTATLVGVTFEYDYGDFFGNFLVRRRVKRALTQMLLRLGSAAMAEA